MNNVNQLPITTYGMEILRKKTAPVKEVNPALINLIQNMFFTMNRASGIGLAAPQVNAGISLAVVDVSEMEDFKNFKPLILINPVVIDHHGKDIDEEGCLSIPGIRAEIERPKDIYLSYHDLDLKEVKIELEGFPARVVQHEIDHLNGVLFTEYFSEEKKREFKKALSDIKKGKIEAQYDLLIHKKSANLKK